jgi:hypothetical protein
MNRVVCGCLVLGLAVAKFADAADAPQTEEDLQREAAIAEFTAKMKALNYPALFDKAAQEFNVPADILKAVAFAETRWEQLTWPPGETASPETGMPRPYGIMSLWDNQFFGHSLLEAAALIGQTPDALKQDAYQNMRGGAALLRKVYDATAKPDGTTEADIESWRYAIRKYCGIPERDLNAQHALDVYVFMSKGYHQYGIEWDARPVNLEPIRAETRRIVAEERAKRDAKLAANSNLLNAPKPEVSTNPKPVLPVPAARQTNKPAAQAAVATSVAAKPAVSAKDNVWWIILAALAALAGVLALYRLRARSSK